jgi:hypothetical protein
MQAIELEMQRERELAGRMAGEKKREADVKASLVEAATLVSANSSAQAGFAQ